MLVAHGLGEADCVAVVLATEEAANNALVARKASSCRIEVSVALIDEFVCIEVRDAGSGVRGVCVDPARLAGRDAEHGRGLYLMAQLMESLELVPRAQGTLVRMTRQLAKRLHKEAEDGGRLAC